MKRPTLLFLILSAGTLAIIFLIVTVDRLKMNYNEKGVYFDEETLSTYDSQSLIFYYAVTGTLLLLTIVLILRLRKAPSH